jgi:hypothetical protein
LFSDLPAVTIFGSNPKREVGIITFNCSCGVALTVPNEWTAKRVRCQTCGQLAVVPPAPPQPPPAPAPSPAPAVALPPLPLSAPPLAYADFNLQRPGVFNEGGVPLERSLGKPRSALWFLLLSFAWLILNVIAFISLRQVMQSREPEFLLPFLLLAGWFLMGIGVLVYWLLLVFATHKDIRRLTAGAYDISPGKAVGFSFIPGFSAFWVVYMPSRLAGEVNRHLQPFGSGCSKGTVLAVQIASIPLGLILPAMAPLMYSISMLHIQRGLNRVWVVSQPAGV